MATSKPRITITLDEQHYAVLKRLNALNGVPMSRTVSEFVELVSPVLERVCDNLERVRIADENVRSRIVKSAESSLKVLEGLSAEVLDNFDMFSDELSNAIAEEQSRRRETRDASAEAAHARAIRGGDAPPPSNTGVRSGKSTGNGG
mgnify:FL=1